MSDLALITESELSYVEDNSLNAKQLKNLLKRTPSQYVKQRPAKGGGSCNYVTGGYVKKVLNLMFGWDWDFEILDEQIFYEAKEVVVKGKLTCRTNGRTIVKMQYGNKDIICKKETTTPLSIGNDLKAAATDALKKCASEIGVAADIYNAEDFREVNVNEDPLTQITELFQELEEHLKPDDAEHIRRIIDNKESKSYTKALKLLKQVKDEQSR